jgi:hypothetical protein
MNTIELPVIINPYLITIENEYFEYKNLIKCNNNINVKQYIKKHEKYIIELPNEEIVLHVVCTYNAINAADIKIISMTKNGIRNYEYDNCIISYKYEYYNKIHFDSFEYMQYCNVYISLESILNNYT